MTKSTMKKILLLLIFCCTITQASAQFPPFQSHPKLVMEEIFRAAYTEEYSNLSALCPPDQSNDGDTQKYICDIASGSNTEIAEFLSSFKTAKITGDVEYDINEDGNKTASIPFWFNHSGGESRSKETMNMVKIDDKWYLMSF